MIKNKFGILLTGLVFSCSTVEEYPTTVVTSVNPTSSSPLEDYPIIVDDNHDAQENFQRDNDKRVSKPDMRGLDIQTQYHIERLCRHEEGFGVISFWNCLGDELRKIQNASKPDMSKSQ